MKHRTALVIAAVVTAFLLVTAGGVLARVALTSATTGTADAATTIDVSAEATLDPQVEALLQQREAQYQAQLTAANNRLQEAYAQQQALAAQLEQAQSVAPSASASAATTSTGYAISAEQAVLLALSVAPGNSAAYLPDLVSFQGIPAYEVALSGGLVYVDANTGDVLYNGAATAGFEVPSFGGESHEGHEEHEGHGDDHDD